MELKYLQTFLAIVETGSFSRAAVQLNYTRSTITYQMQQLEAELQIPNAFAATHHGSFRKETESAVAVRRRQYDDDKDFRFCCQAGNLAQERSAPILFCERALYASPLFPQSGDGRL